MKKFIVLLLILFSLFITAQRPDPDDPTDPGPYPYTFWLSDIASPSADSFKYYNSGIYDTISQKFYYWDGVAWVQIASDTSSLIDSAKWAGNADSLGGFYYTYYLTNVNDTFGILLGDTIYVDSIYSPYGKIDTLALDTIIGDYWDSLKILGTLDSFVTDRILEDTLDEYWDSTTTISRLDTFVTDRILSDSLNSYYDTTTIKTLYIDTAEIKSYWDSTTTISRLDTFVTDNILTDSLDNYWDSTTTISRLDTFVTDNILEDSLNSYYDTTAIKIRYIDTTEIKSYWDSTKVKQVIEDSLDNYWDSTTTISRLDTFVTDRILSDSLNLYWDSTVINDTLGLFARLDTLDYYLNNVNDTFGFLSGDSIEIDTIIGDYWDSLTTWSRVGDTLSNYDWHYYHIYTVGKEGAMFTTLNDALDSAEARGVDTLTIRIMDSEFADTLSTTSLDSIEYLIIDGMNHNTSAIVCSLNADSHSTNKIIFTQLNGGKVWTGGRNNFQSLYNKYLQIQAFIDANDSATLTIKNSNIYFLDTGTWDDVNIYNCDTILYSTINLEYSGTVLNGGYIAFSKFTGAASIIYYATILESNINNASIRGSIIQGGYHYSIGVDSCRVYNATLKAPGIQRSIVYSSFIYDSSSSNSFTACSLLYTDVYALTYNNFANNNYIEGGVFSSKRPSAGSAGTINVDGATDSIYINGATIIVDSLCAAIQVRNGAYANVKNSTLIAQNTAPYAIDGGIGGAKIELYNTNIYHQGTGTTSYAIIADYGLQVYLNNVNIYSKWTGINTINDTSDVSSYVEGYNVNIVSDSANALRIQTNHCKFYNSTFETKNTEAGAYYNPIYISATESDNTDTPDTALFENCKIISHTASNAAVKITNSDAADASQKTIIFRNTEFIGPEDAFQFVETLSKDSIAFILNDRNIYKTATLFDSTNADFRPTGSKFSYETTVGYQIQDIALDTIKGDYWDSLMIISHLGDSVTVDLDTLNAYVLLDSLSHYWDSLTTIGFINDSLAVFARLDTLDSYTTLDSLSHYWDSLTIISHLADSISFDTLSYYLNNSNDTFNVLTGDSLILTSLSIPGTFAVRNDSIIMSEASMLIFPEGTYQFTILQPPTNNTGEVGTSTNNYLRGYIDTIYGVNATFSGNIYGGAMVLTGNAFAARYYPVSGDTNITVINYGTLRQMSWGMQDITTSAYLMYVDSHNIGASLNKFVINTYTNFMQPVLFDSLATFYSLKSLSGSDSTLITDGTIVLTDSIIGSDSYLTGFNKVNGDTIDADLVLQIGTNNITSSSNYVTSTGFQATGYVIAEKYYHEVNQPMLLEATASGYNDSIVFFINGKRDSLLMIDSLNNIIARDNFKFDSLATFGRLDANYAHFLDSIIVGSSSLTLKNGNIYSTADSLTITDATNNFILTSSPNAIGGIYVNKAFVSYDGVSYTYLGDGEISHYMNDYSSVYSYMNKSQLALIDSSAQTTKFLAGYDTLFVDGPNSELTYIGDDFRITDGSEDSLVFDESAGSLSISGGMLAVDYSLYSYRIDEVQMEYITTGGSSSSYDWLAGSSLSATADQAIVWQVYIPSTADTDTIKLVWKFIMTAAYTPTAGGGDSSSVYWIKRYNIVEPGDTQPQASDAIYAQSWDLPDTIQEGDIFTDTLTLPDVPPSTYVQLWLYRRGTDAGDKYPSAILIPYGSGKLLYRRSKL